MKLTTLILVSVLIVGCYSLPKYRRFPRRDPRNIDPKRPSDDNRIVNGVDAEPGDAPFIISYETSSGFHFCGGIIYNKNWVITAGHCVDGTSDSPPEEYIVAGSLLLSSGGQQVLVDKVMEHYQHNSFTYENDIALLHLQEELIFEDGVIGAADLPDQQNPGDADPYTEGNFGDTYPDLPDLTQDASYFIVLGWGTLTPGGNSPDNLKKVNAAYITDAKCNDPPAPADGYDGDVLESMICAGGAGGNHDSCQGDSGGPMVEAGPDGGTAGTTVGNTLVGIVSWGYSCGVDGYPGVYTQVSYHVDWIRNAVSCFDNGGTAESCDDGIA